MIHVEDGQIVIRVSLEESHELRQVVKSIPGTRYDRDRYLWTVPLVHIQEVAQLFPEQLYHMSFDDALADAKAREFARNNESLVVPDLTRRTPRTHQSQGYQFASRLEACMLNMHMGTGKTKVAIDLIQNDITEGRVLILAPKTIVRDQVWPREFAKDAAVPYHTLTLLDQTVAKRQKALESFWAQPGLRVAITNHEAAWRDPLGAWLMKQSVDWLIIDESHRAKMPMGRFSKWLARWAPGHARRTLALTGTPMPHSPLDVFAQFRFLDPTVFGDHYVAFRNRYANVVTVPQLPAPIIKGYKHLDELQRRMDTITFSAGPEVLDLPEEQHIDIAVTLEPKALRAYKEMETFFITQLQDGVVTAGNALVKLLRLQQLTSGWLRADDSEVPDQISTAKRDVLDELLEDMPQDEPIVVFCRFHTDLDDVRWVAEEKHRRNYYEISGRGQQLDAWRLDENGVLGVQIQAGGVGIDLTKARYCVYYSLGFSLGDYLQSLSRINRPGQERPVIYYHLVAQKTVDEAVYKALQERRDLVEAVLEEVGR